MVQQLSSNVAIAAQSQPSKPTTATSKVVGLYKFIWRILNLNYTIIRRPALTDIILKKMIWI